MIDARPSQNVTDGMCQIPATEAKGGVYLRGVLNSSDIREVLV